MFLRYPVTNYLRLMTSLEIFKIHFKNCLYLHHVTSHALFYRTRVIYVITVRLA